MLIGQELIKAATPLGIAALAGLLVGLEREVRRQPAGIRTNILIAVAASLYTVTGVRLGHDPSRIAAQVVSGMGFLGAGVIVRSGFTVRGITTAATVWTVGAIGVAAGAGYYSASLACTLLTVLILAIRPLTRAVSHGFAPRVVIHGAGADLADAIVAKLAELSVTAGSISSVTGADVTVTLWRLRMPPECNVGQLIGALARTVGVTRIETEGFGAAGARRRRSRTHAAIAHGKRPAGRHRKHRR
jgi:putative Mg2+ transporter-C (MgtC) family protein